MDAINEILPLTIPLCILHNGKLLCYRYRKLLVVKDGKVEKEIPVSVGAAEKLLGWCRLASRLLRFGVRVAAAIDDSHAIICIGNTLHEVDIERGSVSKGWYCGDGVRPLLMTLVKEINGFSDGLYFGGYLMNREKKPVHIYHRIGTDKWEIAFTFPEGTINHVHNVVADPYRQCIWIFTGDFDESAAIWKVTNGFECVERVVCNDQNYRGCVVNVLPEGLLYATDAPFADNYIYLMNPESFEIKPVFPLHGSCIYGCQWNKQYVFSSTVEGDGRNTSRLEFYFGRKRGSGIKDDYVHMYLGNLQEGFREIYKEKKDSMPYYTFQFGVFKFPTEINNTEKLYFQPVATKKNDLQLMCITLRM